VTDEEKDCVLGTLTDLISQLSALSLPSKNAQYLQRDAIHALEVLADEVEAAQ
jgi:hypothetical protein